MGSETKETQVAIIGGGIVGTAIARELSKYKVDVCLLEKEPDLGWGITKGSQGLVHGGIAYLSSRIVKRLDTKMDFKSFLKKDLNMKEKLGFVGREMFFELAPLLNMEIIRCGRMMVAEDKEELETLRLIKEVAEEKGVEGIEILDRRGLEEKEPLINSKFVGSLYDPSECAISPVEWAIAFGENARDNGVKILTEMEVRGIERKNGYYLIKTSKGKMKAEYVVNAAGVFADEISAMIGKDDFSIFFFHCQMLILENRNYIHHLLCRIPQPGFPRMLVPTTEGNIAVVHTMDRETNKHNRSTTREGLNFLFNIPPDLIPSISPRRDALTSFVGFLAFNNKIPDDYLLECPQKKFINAVICPPGLGPAPAVAQKVVEMLHSEGLELIEKTDFNPYRFKHPRFIDFVNEEKNREIRGNPRYGNVVCHCERVTEGEIVEAIKRGATTLDGIKFRTRAGMGRCQGNFCGPKTAYILARELNRPFENITKKGEGSNYVVSRNGT